MVGVAQLVERRIVIPVVVGSIPIVHPIYFIRFNSSLIYPSYFLLFLACNAMQAE